MFAVENLWQIDALKPLQKVHEAFPLDRRLVVVADNSPAGVNVAETVAMHAWLESQGYQFIPDTWESNDLTTLEVVHISKLTIQIMRRNPFSPKPAPLAPNSWLAKLPQERFDALLLAQQTGDVPLEPTTLYIRDTLMPQLTAADPSPFWQDILADVEFAQSGAAPRNARQKQVLANWERATKRRHYDPTNVTMAPDPAQPQQQRADRTYVWYDPGTPCRWNERLTQLRNWIVSQIRDTEDLRTVIAQILGTTAYVKITGRTLTDAHALVEEAMKRDKLNDLAAFYDFVQEAPTSAFNQVGQRVVGDQINVTIGAGATQVAVGKNVVQFNNVAGNTFVRG